MHLLLRSSSLSLPDALPLQVLVHRERMALPPPYADDGPAASDASYFTITEDQLAAEKAVMLALNLPEDSEYISNGKIIKDYTADGITIREGSVISLSETSSTTRSLRNSGKISLKLDISADGYEFPVEYTGMQDGDSIRTETFSGKESYGSTPAAIICSDSKESLENLIKAFVSDTKIPDGFDIVPERSFYDNFQSGKGWIEFRSSAIDESMHKVNFTITGDGITEMMLDGWCISDTNGIRASANPFIREDGAPLSDQEALEIAPSLLAFYLYMQAIYTDPIPLGIISYDGWSFELKNLYVPSFFGEPVHVTGKETQDLGGSGNIVFDLMIGEHRVEMEMSSDSFVEYLRIDGKGYNHLSNRLSQINIEYYLILRPLWVLFDYAVYGSRSFSEKGSCKNYTDGAYQVFEFENFYPGGLFSPYITGTMKVSDKDFYFDIEMISSGVPSESSAQHIAAEGVLLENGKYPQFTSLTFFNSSHVYSDYELNANNVIYGILSEEAEQKEQ